MYELRNWENKILLSNLFYSPFINQTSTEANPKDKKYGEEPNLNVVEAEYKNIRFNHITYFQTYYKFIGNLRLEN